VHRQTTNAPERADHERADHERGTTVQELTGD